MGELLKREDQRVEDTWDLTSIFESDEKWEEAYKEVEDRLSEADTFREKGIQSSDDLLEVLEAERDLGVTLSQVYVLSLIHISEPTRREWLSRMPSSA